MVTYSEHNHVGADFYSKSTWRRVFIVSGRRPLRHERSREGAMRAHASDLWWYGSLGECSTV